MVVQNGYNENPEDNNMRTVSIILPVYNAEKKIKAKIENTLMLDYPKELIEIIVVSDGSTDNTAKILKEFDQPNLFAFSMDENRGKSAVQNYAAEIAKNDIILFTDVDSLLDHEFLKKIMSYFSYKEVACVGGKAVLLEKSGDIASSQSLYWKVEQFLRLTESKLGMLHSLSGWGFAIRKKDFVTLDCDTGDDLILPLDMAIRGKNSVIAKDALVYDYMPSSLKGEIKARARITLRNITGLLRRKTLLIPWKYPKMAFAIWSHKLLRWLSPIFLILMLFTNLWITFKMEMMIYTYSLAVQIIFYLMGVLGILLSMFAVKVPAIKHVASFLIANYGLFLGILKFVFGKKIRGYTNES